MAAVVVVLLVGGGASEGELFSESAFPAELDVLSSSFTEDSNLSIAWREREREREREKVSMLKITIIASYELTLLISAWSWRMEKGNSKSGLSGRLGACICWQKQTLIS